MSLSLLLGMQVLFDLGRADFRRARKVYDLYSFVLQEVELPFPVITHDEGINVIFMHVAALLIPVFFRDHQIHVADRLQERFSLLIGEIAFLLLFLPVEFVRGEADDQVIAVSLRPAEQIDMSVMKQVKGSVCNHASHDNQLPNLSCKQTSLYKTIFQLRPE